jgi:hypothetical protein
VWEQVKPDECVWNVNDSKCTIYLEKERESWWKSALHGDTQIDTTKVDSVKRVDEYDGETQGAIRKIMFDQDQKRKGLPTSDELKHADILKEVRACAAPTRALTTLAGKRLPCARLLRLPTSPARPLHLAFAQAWNTDGSPFKGTPFNPGMLAPPGGGEPLPTDGSPGGRFPHERRPAGPERPPQPGSGARMQELPDDI